VTEDNTEEEEKHKASKDFLLPRKVSFCEQCHHNSKVSLHNSAIINGAPGPGVQKTVVRSYSIDKMRPKCYTCNPTGDIPYPSRRDSGDYYDNV